MKKITISGIKIDVTYEDQALNMGGPPIGNVSVDGKLISTNCIVNNFVFHDDMKLLFFVKWHVVTKYYYYFTINFWKKEDWTVYQFDNEFNMVYLKQFITSSKLEAYNAFHDKIADSRFIFDIDTEIFKQTETD